MERLLMFINCPFALCCKKCVQTQLLHVLECNLHWTCAAAPFEVTFQKSFKEMRHSELCIYVMRET